MKALLKKIFRAYDIRGIAESELPPEVAFQIGRSIGSQLIELGESQVLLGRDGRLSSPVISRSLVKGLCHVGCDVIDLGEIPTPALYFAIRYFDIPNGLVVTGSHNAPEYNGIKIVMQNQCLHTTGISNLYNKITTKDLLEKAEQQGQHHNKTVLDEYVNALSSEVKIHRPLRVGLDCGNGATALVAEKIFEKYGGEIYPLYCDLDGSFPNHSPDPTQPENLKDLQNLVRQQRLDIGFAFDGDGDRMIAVDGKGNILWPDRIMALLVNDVLQQRPKSVVAYDVKCGQLLKKAIYNAGGEPSMCISGHSLLKAHMKETNAIMGGEFSGHIILNDRNWGYADDGLYAASRLLETLSNSNKTPTQVFADLPDSYMTPEYKLYFDSYDAAASSMEKLCENYDLDGARITNIDGIRADFNDCWGLARISNTSPTITLRFEGQTQAQLDYVQELFRRNIYALNLPILDHDGFEIYDNVEHSELLKAS